MIYVTGHFLLRGGDINAETTYAAQDGKEPRENRLLGPSCLDCSFILITYDAPAVDGESNS